MISTIFIVAAILAPTSVIAGPFPSKPIISSSKTSLSLVKNNNQLDNVVSHLKKTVNRVITGVKSIPDNYFEAERLKKIRKLKGNNALTYNEYKFIEKSSEDLSKLFRMVITIPFSPEFFFYSYIVFPAMASTNPFAWTSMPSGFDADASDKKKRSDILTKRRAQTLVNSLVTLRGETVEVGNEEKNTRREEQLKIIQKALTRGSMRESIKDCLPFLTTENDKKATSLKMKLLDVPGSIVKGCCRSVGIEGLPNIPLINKLNLGESYHIFHQLLYFY
jgi:hypothetical protein